MGPWLEAFEQLPDLHQERVKRWIHLQRFIADTLEIPFERWIEDYIGSAMEAPFDYRFMQDAAFEGLQLSAETYSRDLDPATARTARVPLKAQNQMGRFSPGFQSALSQRLEQYEDQPFSVAPSDVVVMQKLLASQKELVRLKRKDFRSVRCARLGHQIQVYLEGAYDRPLVSMDVLAWAAMLNRPNL